MSSKDEFVYTQELMIQDVNHTAKAYFQFIEGSLSVKVVDDCSSIQYDFDVHSETLMMLAYAYIEHAKDCDSKIN